MSRRRILYLCTGNSCRSQMAEGWTRHLHGDRYEPWSAGILAKGLDRRAVQVMAEAGVDISSQTSDRLDRLAVQQFDDVVTVCGDAEASCPSFPGTTRRIHVGFDDPPRLAAALADEERKLECYRRVRDEIRAFVETLPARLD